MWKVKSDDSVDKWISVKDVWRLSVTVDGLVVMLVKTADVQGSVGSQMWHGRLLVYNAVGVQLTNIKLSNSVNNPRCVVQTTIKTFIISHGNSGLS